VKDVSKKERPLSQELQKEARAAAFLYSRQFSEQSIGEMLGLERSTVSRRLKWARAQGYITERPVCLLNDDDIRELVAFPLEGLLEQELASAIGRANIGKITIVPAATENQETLRRVGIAAALRLHQLATDRRMRLVGVGWGVTIQAVTKAVKYSNELQRLSEEATRQMTFVPMVGDLLQPWENQSHALAASTLAADLTRAFGGSLENQSYLWTPAYIPKRYLQSKRDQKKLDQDEGLQLIQDFLECLVSHRRIFGSADGGDTEPRLIDRFDTMISGVGGRVTIPSWYLRDHILEDEESIVEHSTVGDLCGRLIPARDASEEERKRVDRINERVFVPSIEDFRRCARRASADGTPGTVIVATGSHKADVLVEVCHQGLATELIIDHLLAEAVLKAAHRPARSVSRR
jgi:DNA-binding transcriptional regulator LsrR (DeoR family)